jgi:hypothetical protein
MTEWLTAAKCAEIMEAIPHHADVRSVAMACGIPPAWLHEALVEGLAFPDLEPLASFARAYFQAEAGEGAKLLATCLRVAEERGQAEVMRRLLEQRFGPGSLLEQILTASGKCANDVQARRRALVNQVRVQHPVIVDIVTEAGFRMVPLCITN